MPPNILIVEYDVLEQQYLDRELKRRGYTVDTASTGFTALEKLEKDRFDVVIADGKIPYMSGLELLRKMRERDIESEVILTPARVPDGMEEEAAQLGAHEVIRKCPVNFGRLVEVVDRIVNHTKQ